jgi:nucleosome binding factor SPN SPT16 subunit
MMMFVCVSLCAPLLVCAPLFVTVWFFVPVCCVCVSMYESQLTSKLQVGLLRPLEPALERLGCKASFIVRQKGAPDAPYMEEALAICRAAGSSVAVLSKDKHEGDFAAAWSTAFGNAKLTSVELAGALGFLFATKDTTEMGFVRQASEIAARAMTKVFESKMSKIIDASKKTPHKDLAQSVERAILEPSTYDMPVSVVAFLVSTRPLSRVLILTLVQTLNKDVIEVAFTPIIQSGGNYNLKLSAESDDKILSSGVIICRLGARFQSYCGFAGRTFFINPTPTQKANYKLVLELHAEVLRLLRPGTSIKAVFGGVQALLERSKPELKDKLHRPLGHGMGLEIRESTLVLNETNEQTIAKGMVFAITLGLSDLDDGDGKKYAIFIGDTVHVSDAETLLLTNSAGRKFGEVSYDIEDDADGEAAENQPRESVVLNTRTRGEARSRDPAPSTQSVEEKSRLNYLAFKEISERARARLLAARALGAGLDEVPLPESYRQESELPRERPVREHRLYVDRARDCVLIPIYGQAVPFHLAIVKNVSKSEHAGISALRINFENPTLLFRSHANIRTFPYLRELTVRSADGRHLDEVMREIREAQKLMKQRYKEQKEKESIVVQEDLQLIVNRPVTKLKDVTMFPALGRQKETGVLEVHANGFRYVVCDGVCDGVCV